MQRSIMDFRKISGCSQLWRERCRNVSKKYEALTGVKPIRVHDIRHSHVALSYLSRGRAIDYQGKAGAQKIFR